MGMDKLKEEYIWNLNGSVGIRLILAQVSRWIFEIGLFVK